MPSKSSRFRLLALITGAALLGGCSKEAPKEETDAERAVKYLQAAEMVKVEEAKLDELLSEARGVEIEAERLKVLHRTGLLSAELAHRNGTTNLPSMDIDKYRKTIADADALKKRQIESLDTQYKEAESSVSRLRESLNRTVNAQRDKVEELRVRRDGMALAP